MSYTWRIILHGVEPGKQGVIWRIGDAEKVNIWQYLWIPRVRCRRIITPRGASILSEVYLEWHRSLKTSKSNVVSGSLLV
jgi:hypothetical protein